MARPTLALVIVALLVMSTPGVASATSETSSPTNAPSPASSATPSAELIVTGIITTIESPALGRIDGFELRAEDGRTYAFDATELESRPEFPTAHLSEHQVLSAPIRVTYHEDGERLVVTRVDDAD